MLHFVFEWSGRRIPLALISAVNESTWEHLKLAFFPTFFFSIIEYRFLKGRANNFILAKTVSLYVIPISIVALFYLYLWILGHDSLFLDIAIFILSIGIGQFVSYKILTYRKLPKTYEICSLFFLFLILLAFILLTYFPPHIEIFRDPIAGGFGIVER